ncbi:MAG: type II toxin-antitoxin system HicB family antitoxin [Candidatus Binatia bacterium]
MSIVRYKVRLERSEEGVSASVPALPGCWSQGKDEPEALANVREAILDYLAVIDEQLRDAEVREIEVTL